MSIEESRELDFRHPRETADFFGHAAAEKTLLDAYRSGRMAHAWMIGGPPGIGKATLAYRMARFILAYPNPEAPAVQSAESLAVDPDHPVARQLAAQAHSDLLALERTINEETGRLFTVIRVDDVRRTIPFFGSTAGAGGWRVCIVDSADELHPSASNALLKMLEEPPPRSLFLLVSHAPARLLATIRSRCRRLDLRPLGEEDVVRAAAALSNCRTDAPDLLAAAAAAEGSVARALALLDPDAVALRRSVAGLLDRLPQTDPLALHALGEALGRADRHIFAAFVEIVNGWLSARLNAGRGDTKRLARVAEAWETVNRTTRDAATYNLDRKPVVFSVFALLADTARG